MSRTMTRISFLAVLLCSLPLGLLGQQRSFPKFRDKPILVPARTQEPQADAGNPSDTGTYITFDAPGAGTGANQGTFAAAINSQGAIAGYYYDANFVGHGFVRDSNGTITAIDVPGSQGTYAHAISPSGVITGQYFDGNSIDHGFVRAVDGSFTTFDVPGAYFFNTVGGIDPAGDVTGTYFDTNFVSHGFLRSSGGTVNAIDVPGASGTQAFGITPGGTVAGCYADANSVGHGFTRTRDGALTTFDLPNPATYEPGCSFDYGYAFGIALVGINPSGRITGAYFQPISGNPFGGNYRGFLRDKDGSYMTFDAVASPSSPCCTWTFGVAINPAGVIVGFDNDYINLNHGFIRAKDGTVTILDAPGAGKGYNQGTFAFSINPAGEVAGQYLDANYAMHSFVRRP